MIMDPTLANILLMGLVLGVWLLFAVEIYTRATNRNRDEILDELILINDELDALRRQIAAALMDDKEDPGT